MSRWQDLQRMLDERRLGFLLSERLVGSHVLCRELAPGTAVAGAELPLEFAVDWGARHLQRFLNPLHPEFMRARLSGTITAGGLCQQAPLHGQLTLRYLQDSSLHYDFDFEAQGRRWHYHGEKRDIRPWNLHRSHTTCFGLITEAASGERLSDAVVHFPLSQLPRFMLSLRWG